jgi:hypothetical protein
VEAGVTRLRALVTVAVVVTLAACDDDPARSVKIVAHPPATADSVVAPPGTAAPAIADWRPDACPPPPEDAPGPSMLTVSGPCAFEHHGAAACEGVGDDLLVTVVRPAARGAQVMMYINVERYHGPDHYTDAQMWLGVQDKAFIYRWSSDTVSITVASDEAYVVLPVTRLDAEPLLIECSGPMNNYQCSGRGNLPSLEASAEVVAGRLDCALVPRKQE